MRKYKGLSILIITSFAIMGFTKIVEMVYQEPLQVELKPLKEISIKIEIPDFEINQTDLFLNSIGHYESSNRYKIVNRFGYMGKYQFGKSTLIGLGYDVTRKEFLNSPYLQEKAMLDLLHHNRKILKSYIEYWDGKKVKGKIITESGILAAAHLVGPASVKKFFNKGKITKDGNGTSLITYLHRFSGYDLNLE